MTVTTHLFYWFVMNFLLKRHSSLATCTCSNTTSEYRTKIALLREENSTLFSQNNKLMNQLESTSYQLQQCREEVSLRCINPYHVTDLFWHPLKTSENLWFSDVFRRYQKSGMQRLRTHVVDCRFVLNNDLENTFDILYQPRYCWLWTCFFPASNQMKMYIQNRVKYQR